MDINTVIRSLRPNSEFVIVNDDISTLQFHSNHTIPTKDEIDSKWKELEVQEILEKEQIAIRRQNLLNKLGITEDEAKLLLS